VPTLVVVEVPADEPALFAVDAPIEVEVEVPVEEPSATAVD
jgi:hypothetical protein